MRILPLGTGSLVPREPASESLRQAACNSGGMT